MDTKIFKILIVNSSVDDASLLQQALVEGGLHVDCLHVATIEAARNMFVTRRWDIVLSDNDLPQLSARDVFQLMVDQDLDVPFIVVSGHAGEEEAEALMDLGADDYIVKSNLARLIPAIKRSLKAVDNFQQFNQAQAELQKTEERFRAITSNLPGVVFQFLLNQNRQLSFPYVSDASETLLGMSPKVLMATPTLFAELILPCDKVIYDRLMAISVEQLSTLNWEGRIQVKGDSDIKWISLRATPRRTSDGDTLWDGIMINITRNKLAEREIARSREQLAELSSYLQKVKEHERALIAREIHDDIGGTLTAIKCELFPCIDPIPRLPVFYQKKAASIECLVDRVIDSTRRISLDLRPGVLDCGIVAAIQWQAKEFSNRIGISCRVTCGNEEILLDSDLSIAIFRVFQETLTNISKHSSATHVEVSLVESDGIIILEISDNGCGITDSDLDKQDSFGIRGMRERCQQLKGIFDISGSASKGTKVEIRIPIEDTESQALHFAALSTPLEKTPQSGHSAMQQKAS
ncbi:MAG: histidine kinase [Nitrosomonas sp.]|nr:histidine kinase [Nitrosomonas sp.]